MNLVEKLTRIPLKEAFTSEARELTPWLRDNIDVIGEAIGIELTNAVSEQTTGNFYVDIKAQTIDGDIVVIENQFGSSDHDHLGKLITYLTSFEAKLAVWIVERPKQEHINVITWLNESNNGCDFYLLKLEAIKISESNPAPLLTTIAGPSEESKIIGNIKKENTDQDLLRQKFWTSLLNLLPSYGVKIFANSNTSGRYAYIAVTAGVRGMFYEIWVNQSSCRIELRIDYGKGQDELNLKALTVLLQNKEAVEKVFEGELNWAELEGFRACSIRKDYNIGGYLSPEENWQHIISEVAVGMKKLIGALNPLLSQVKL